MKQNVKTAIFPSSSCCF